MLTGKEICSLARKCGNRLFGREIGKWALWKGNGEIGSRQKNKEKRYRLSVREIGKEGNRLLELCNN